MQKDLTTDKRILLLDTRFRIVNLFLSLKCKASEVLWGFALDVRDEVVAVQMIVALS
jgi:hypothetical protein